jgi:small-conductance mechanosensitive channel
MLKGRAISDFLKGRAISDFVVGALIMSYLYLGQIDKPPYPVDLLISYVLATLAIYLGLAKLISHFFSHKNKEEKKNKERKFLLDDEEVDKELALITLSIIGYLYFLSFPIEGISETIKPYQDINNYLLLSSIVGFELFAYSLLSFSFRFSKVEETPPSDTGNLKKDTLGYDSKYHCLELIEESKEHPFKLIKPVVFLIHVSKTILFAVFIFSTLKIFDIKGANQIGTIFAGAGGSIAALAFVFKEGLKSIAAGIRIWTDDLVEVGEKIKSSSLGINGIVKEITLTNIKIHNLDNTISNIPLEKIITSDFVNKSEFKIHGRRIEFTINIDIDSIRSFSASDEDSETWNAINNIEIIQDYLDCKKTSIGKYHDNTGNYANNRKQTNIGIFREYIKEYLLCHTFINRDRGVLVRNKIPSVDGLPVLILAHVNPNAISTQVFRTIESDIIDHIVSVVKTFDLKLLQHKER